MSNSDSTGTSRADWTKIDALADGDIDTSEVHELTEQFFRRATWRHGPPVEATVNVDPDVLAWYQAQGGDWQRRLGVAIRVYAEAHVRS